MNEMEILRAELAAARKENKRLVCQIEIEREEHNREANALAARVKVESGRHVEAFQNALADKLRLEWRDFQDVSELPMSLEIGNGHRRQMRGIFALLEDEGVSVNH